jgi:antitoxin component of RelBE/YafQ-DinJ toxin-antitoxin module
MPRMGKNGYSDAETGQAKVTTRCPEELKEEYQQVLDEQGRSMSEDVREHMQAVVNASEGTSIGNNALPDNERLATAYKALRRHADPDTGGIETDVAETIVAEATSVRASVIRSNVLRPLQRRGYIRPKWGTIEVVPPEEAAPTA